MKKDLAWERRWVSGNGGLREFVECRLRVEGDRMITGLVGRIERVKHDQEEAEVLGVDEMYYPALDLELFRALRVCVRGGFPIEPWPLPFGGSLSADDWDACASGDAEKMAALNERRKADRGGDVFNTKHLGAEGEYEFEEAEDVVRDFIREVVSAIREDAAAIQQAFGGDVLSVSEVAELFGVPRNTVLNWIKTGSLRAFRLGSKWMIEKKDLASAVEESKARPSVSVVTQPGETEKGPIHE
ncbi:MAG: helix-turn-helix domain-containing protein [Terracidiphilus sp.]|nr:helix-turn-helix domain-containing protein [Terracidiphilus sp.]